MGTLLRLIFSVLVIYESLIHSVHCSLYSSPDNAVKFSECVSQKIGASPHFSPEDHEDVNDFSNIMVNAMRHLSSNSRVSSILKTFVLAFINSLADLVVIEDPSTYVLRKNTYTQSIEECSISSTGYVDVEFVNDASRIMTLLEKVKIRVDGGTIGSSAVLSAEKSMVPQSNPQVPLESFDSSAVQPSPVQSPYVPINLDFSDKTVLNPPGNSFDSSSSAGIVHTNTRPPYPAQPISSVHSLGSPANFRILKSEQQPFSSESSSTPTESKIYKSPTGGFHPPLFGDLKSLQSDESTMAFIPPPVNPKFIIDEPPEKISNPKEEIIPVDSSMAINPHQSPENIGNLKPAVISQLGNETFQEYSLSETEKISIQNTSTLNPKPMQESLHNTEPPTFSIQTRDEIEGKTDEPLIFSLENIISSILINSPSFKNAFSSETGDEDIIALAKTIIEQSLSGYDPEIVKQSLDNVSSALSTVTLKSPENYASAFSNALASVLKQHNMPLFVDGAKIASSILTNLGNTNTNYDQETDSTEEIITDSSSNGDISSSFKEEKLLFDFDSPILVPEDVNSEIFSDTLRQKLTGSFRLANLFCGTDHASNRIQMYFNLIKSSLSMYGTQISSIAASTISEALMEIPENSLCSSYANIISDMIAEIFYENGSLEMANAEEIHNQMELSVSNSQLVPKQTDTAEISEISLIGNGSMFSESILDLQSSNRSDDSARTTIKQPIEDSFPDVINYKNGRSNDSDYLSLQQRNEKYSPTISDDSFISPSDSIQISTRSEHNPKYKYTSDYRIPYTTPLSIKNRDQEHTEAVVLIEVASKIKETPIKKLLSSSSDNNTTSQEEFSADLLAKVDSSLKAMNDTSLDLVTPILSSTLIPIDIIVTSNPENIDIILSQLNTTCSSRNSGQCRRRRRRKKNKSKTPQANSEAGSDETDFEVYEIILPGESTVSERSEIKPTTPQATSKASLNKENEDDKTLLSSESTVSERKINKSTTPQSDYKTSLNQNDFKDDEKLLPGEYNASERRENKPTTPQANSKSSLVQKDVDDDEIVLSSESTVSENLPPQLESTNVYQVTDEFALPSAGDNVTVSPVELQPSFQAPPSIDTSSESEEDPPMLDDTDYEDLPLLIAKAVSQISLSSIAFIRSEKFNMVDLCQRLNVYADVVSIPPVSICEETAVIDYLLNVLRSVTKILKGV